MYKIIILAVLFVSIYAYKANAIDSYFLRVITPNRGQNLVVGQTYPITWSASPNISNVTIGYSGDNGIFGTIASHIGSTSYYNWIVNIGNTIYNNSKVYIWIAGYQSTLPIPVIIDTSDSSFNVWINVPSPTPVIKPRPTTILIGPPIVKE